MSEGEVELCALLELAAQNEAIEKAGRLANMLLEMPERLAGNGDEEVLQQGLDAIKHVVEFALISESEALEALRTYFIPLLEVKSQESRTRSNKGSKKRKRNEQCPQLTFLDPTPLDGLTVENVNEEQLWHQLELKNERMVALLGAAMVETNTEQEELEKELDEEEDLEVVDEVDDKKKRGKKPLEMRSQEGGDSEASETKVLHSIKDLSDDQLRSLGIDPERREEIEMLEEEPDEDDDFLDDSDEEEEEESHGYPGASDLSDDDEMHGKIVMEPLRTEEQQRKRQAQVAAEERRQARRQMRLKKLMGIQSEDDDGEEEDEYEISSDEDDDEDEDYREEGEEETEDEAEDDEETLLSASERQEGKKQGPPLSMDDLDTRNDTNGIRKGKWKSHATLDDDFFSIDQFNRDTDDYGDDGIDLGEDVDLFRPVGKGGEEEEEDEDEPIFYSDFFAPPPGMSADVKKGKGEGEPMSEQVKSPQIYNLQRKASVRFDEEVAVRHIKARRSNDVELTDELLESLEREKKEHSDEGKGEDDEDEEEEEEEEDDDEEDDEEGDEDGDKGGEEKTMGELNGNIGLTNGADEEEAEDSEQEDVEMDVGETGSVEESFGAESEEEQETAHRVAGDLFADEEQELRGASGSVQSEHERRLQKLQEEIAKLERENVGQKDWTLMGESGSKARPENSLLAESLDFENNQRVKPVTTEDTTATLEDMIKKRILESNFDDVERRANMQAFDFVPSKMLELSDTKSGKSLDQVYEDEMGLGGGESHGEKMNKQLEQDHEEIRRLYDELEYKLDALSNAHFTPKAPKATIQTISNTPAITMEESLPSVSNYATQLAPEEVYDAGRHSGTLQGERSEMTPEEKRRLQRQLRADKKAKNERIDSVKKNVEINRQAMANSRGGRFVGASKRPGGSRNDAKEKEEALNKLMGNKGVSVVAKDGNKQKEGAKKRRIDRDGFSLNASHLKL